MKSSFAKKFSITDLKHLIHEMLLVRTMVAPSKIEGNGLYAAELIPKGTVVSRWIEGFDKTFSDDEVDIMNPLNKKNFMMAASWDGDSWFLSGDDGVYFNHSSSPNIRVVRGDCSPATWDRIAVKDILPGEELTMNYAEIGIDPLF